MKRTLAAAECAAIVMGLATAALGGEQSPVAVETVKPEIQGTLTYAEGPRGLCAQFKNASLKFACGEIGFPARRGTVAFWVKAPAYPYGSVILQTTNLNYSFGLSDMPEVQKRSDGTPNISCIPFGAFFAKEKPSQVVSYWPVPRDTWLHICCTWSADDKGKIRMYINGRHVHRHTVDPNSSFQPGEKLIVGCHVGAQRYFNGLVDEIILRDDVLDEFAVSRLFFSGQYVPDRATRLYLSFNDQTPNGVTVKSSAMKEAGK